MHALVIFSAIVAAASAQWNGAPGWGGHAGGYGSGWAGPPANVVVQNGQVQDTPEVAAEKAKHFALVSEASARASAAGPDNGAWSNGGGYNGAYNGGWNGAEDNGQWNGDTGAPYNGGYNGDNGAYNGGNSGAYNGAYNGGYNGGWNGQPAKIVVNNGQVQETPEVAAARAQHLAALQRAGAQSGPQPHWG